MADASNKDKIIADLGANYNSNDSGVLDEIIAEVTSIASDISNRDESDTRLIPYINKAVKSEYLARGSEGMTGMTSKSEGSESYEFEDIIDKMRTNIIKSGLRRLK